LEFGKVKGCLAAYAITSRGKRKVDALEPMDDAEAIRHALDETFEMARAMAEGFSLPLPPVEDVSPAAERARAGGGPLEPQLLWRIAECMDTASRVGNSLQRLGGSYPLLTALGRSIPQCAELVAHIRSSVDSSGTVLDEASEDLKAIRHRIRSLRKRIEDSLRRLIASPEIRPHLQYQNATMCRDRYVLPVNAYRKHEVPGLVHGSSDSGATLYIEPVQIIEPGNDLGEALGEEEEEVRRVLWRLTRSVAAECDNIVNAVDRLGDVDVVRAKGAMSVAFQMRKPDINTADVLELVGARHPLLLRLTCRQEGAAPQSEDLNFGAVVPLDVRLGQDFAMLVITGPNTGGKTVVLKTVGLLCLMARAGMHVPASYANIPLYDRIYADIGDEQSLEQSLSTFSAHMSRVIRILKTATKSSLVLLDDLGAGTDPAEGGALGEAVLKRLVEMGCSAVVVTHLGRLKTFAVPRPQVENASMDFDSRTLQPRYHLTIGTVGSSNALEISERLGLSQAILADARSMLDAESAGQYSSATDQIRLAREDAEERRQRTQFLEQEAERLKSEYEETLARLKAEEARREAGFGLQLRDSLARLHQEADRLYEDTRNSYKSLAKRIRGVRDGLAECLEKVSSLLSGHRLERPLQAGDEVYVVKLHKWGTVERVDRQGERARVRVGDSQIEIAVEELQPWGEGI
jgi:DNA mismatch repair protein MutS2